MRNIQSANKRLFKRGYGVLLLLTFALSGCAGRVSGDLKDVAGNVFLKACDQSSASYALKYSSDAVDDYADESFAGKVSSASFGLIPTYSRTLVHSQVTVFKNSKSIQTLQYQSTVHKFYGFMWIFVLSTENVNRLQADEGGGIRVRWGIHDKTISKAVNQLGLNQEADEVCEIPDAQFLDL
ncbi:MAG TPA: hypothetical protein VGE55_11105 [Limnobacter sp.]|uniref:hypothetical protein n=1 Tax=Limnobacter sp. TaxID=2003368 RepID=UPI002ED9C743